MTARDRNSSNNPSDGRVSTAAMIVMSSMVLSRLTGFIRETMLSWKVGLSWVQDAYVAAFTVPDLMYVLLVGGTISAALVPFISGKLEKGEEKEGWKAASSFINLIFIGLAILCTFGVIFAPQIISLIMPGYSGQGNQTKELAITLARILFPSVSFIMLAGICNGVLNSYKKFAAAAYGPSIYNFGCALSIMLFADTNPQSMIKVAVGVAGSAMLYFLIQFSFVFTKLKYYKPVINFFDTGFRNLFGQAVPSLLSSSVTQVNVIISIAFVSLGAAEGTLAAFRNANTLWQLPYGIFAMGIGTAMLPTLSGKFAAGEQKEYKSLLMKSLTSVLFLAVPSSAAFIVLREPLVRAVFEWGGKFTEKDVPGVASIMAIFSISMITQSIVGIMNRSFYAGQDTRTPLVTGIVSILLNVLFGSVFYAFTDLGASGMALSYSIISTVNAIMLLLLLNRKMNGINMEKFFAFIARAVPATFVMIAVLLLFEGLPFKPAAKALQLVFLAGEIFAGAVFYVVTMIMLKAEDALYLVKLFKQRFKM
ncbi:MAG TPA: murein biosynthesis integral membrane protein MurJ [Clostridia bacterium]|nr:murein biosynthesis integral membrane protein MurJ [Clostridia bacterium]